MIENISQTLLDNLQQLVLPLIIDVEENKSFKQSPDDPSEHQPTWHQFGIITHTRKFADVYQTEAQQYFKEWGIDKNIDKYLSEQLDGKSKKELLSISIPLHDLGKFARGFVMKKGKLKPDYRGHEAISERLIMQDERIRGALEEQGLTDVQLQYIARCAGLHYELAKVRDTARKLDMGYTIAFANSDRLLAACNEIARKFSDFQLELGILFLCDSLAKTDIKIIAENDSDIEAQIPHIESILQKRNLNPALLAAVKQIPVNIAIVRQYLCYITLKNHQ